MAALQDSTASHIYGIPRREWLQLQSPVRYMGNEFGAVHKPWDDVDVRFSLTYPESYEVGSSNLGHIILYTCLNQTPGLLCDRAYFPGADLTAMLARHDKPLFAVESKRPLSDFHCLGFSLSYELGGTNILEMLHQSRVPITAADRQAADDAHRGGPKAPWDPSLGSLPLVFAGGPTASSNPEPFVDFLDFVAMGDGEELLVEIGECLKTALQDGLSRDDTLLRLTSVPGVYVPRFYGAPEGFGGAVYPLRDDVPTRVLRRVATPDPMQQIGLVPYVQTVHDRMTVEIRRGCTRGCRFCQPGMLTRPARDVDPDVVVDAVTEGLRKTGYNDFSLLSLSCSDYLSLPYVGLAIKNRLQDDNVSLSLPSQRVDRFDDDIAHIVSGNKKSGLTFAPEAGTQRMRDIINKGLTNEQLLRGVKTAWDAGWVQVKLYFMIGLPGETDEDVVGIAETIRWLQQHCRDGRHKHLAVNVTISNLTPKPHTPFQWHSVSTSEFRRKQELLKGHLKELPQVKANFTDVEISAMEDFIGRSDRKLGKVVLRAWELGATNDAWWMDSKRAFRCWNAAIEEAGLTWQYRKVQGGEWNSLEKLGDAAFRKQAAEGEKGGRGRIDRGALADSRLDMPLPWDHLDTGISKAWLKTELQRALEAAAVPDCSHSGLCSECGVCGDDFGENVVHEPPPVPEFEGHKRPESTLGQRLRFRWRKSEGDMVFLGNLDTMRLFERAARRAALPVSSDESPFNARSRINGVMALSLGATADAEVLEVILTRPVDPKDALARLQAELPAGITLYSVEEHPCKLLNGALGTSANKLIDRIEYHLAVKLEAPDEVASHADSGSQEATDLKEACRAVLRADEFVVAKKTKKAKPKQVDLRSRLGTLEACGDPFSNPLAAAAGGEVSHLALNNDPCDWGVLKYSSAMLSDNSHLPPTQFMELLNGCLPRPGGRQWMLVHAHRSAIDVLPEPPMVISASQMIRLKQIVKFDGHSGLKKRFGVGPRAGDLTQQDDYLIDGVGKF